MRYLLDTNIVSQAAGGRSSAIVRTRLDQHGHACAVASTTLEEVVFGISRLTDVRRRMVVAMTMQEALSGLDVLPFDEEAARWLGQERARLVSKGRTLGYADLQIAAVAVVRGLIVVTHNVKDFEPVEGVQVEDWLST